MTVHYLNAVQDVLPLIQTLNQGQLCIVTDHNCKSSCLDSILKHHSPPNEAIFSVPPGEQSKSLQTFEKGIDFLTQHATTRSDCLINVGGGVVCDLGGFVAACYKRGIPHINIPTSLLAMVDAAHGGKVGINHGKLKNYIGAFKPAEHSIICPEFLRSLPFHHLLSGFAEMLKHGIIANSDYWNKLKSLDPKTITNTEWLSYIQTSIEIKTTIVNKDELETGLRKTLNFGHTVGHAIESHFIDTTQVDHGHAIAAGMIIEAYIAAQIHNLPTQSYNDISQHIISLYGKLPLHTSHINDLMQYIQADKKNDHDKTLMALPSSIGSCDYDIEVPDEIISDGLKEYISL